MDKTIAPTITGLILAGGRATRMEQRDKGLQMLNDMPLVQHVMARLAPQLDLMMINANRNDNIYQRFGVAVHADVMGNFAGPLAGIHTGLTHCTSPLMLCVPCDSPFIPPNLVQKLYAALEHSNADLALVVTENWVDGVAIRSTENVFALMHSSLLPRLTAFLQQGGRKVSAWHQTLAVVDVLFEDARYFANINTLHELHSFEQQHDTQPI